MRASFLQGVRRAWFLAVLGGVVAACGTTPAQDPATPPLSQDLVVTVSAPPPAVEPLAIEPRAVSRRWQASDIFQYEVSLRRWDGEGFAELSPPLSVVLPQKGERRQEARFTNLRQGARYQVDVLAMGNVGGTAPELPLNSETPARVTFDLSGTQDVANARRESVSVTLDPVPFSGSLTLAFGTMPGFIKSLTVDLLDASSGETRYSASFEPRQTMTLSNLKVGVDYQVRVAAYRANGRLYRTVESEIVRFDPEAETLEQQRTLEIAI